MGINILPFVDIINVGSLTTQLFRHPRRTASLIFHHLFDDFAYMYFLVCIHKKSVNRSLIAYLELRAPPRTDNDK